MLMVPQFHSLILLCQLWSWIMTLISWSLFWLWFVLCCFSELHFRAIHCWRHFQLVITEHCKLKISALLSIQIMDMSVHDLNMSRTWKPFRTWVQIPNRICFFTFIYFIVIKASSTLQCNAFPASRIFISPPFKMHPPSLQLFYFKYFMLDTQKTTLDECNPYFLNAPQGTTYA